MTKNDSRRLTGAVLISILIHLLIFFIMNLFNWFPDLSSFPSYEPVSVQIIQETEPPPVSEISAPEESLPDEEQLSAPEPVVSAQAPIPDEPVSKPPSTGDPAPFSVPDVYDDLFIQEEESAPVYVPSNDTAKEDTKFVPGENKIELETVENPDITNSTAGETAPDSPQTPVVSDSDLSALENSFEQSGAAGSDNSSDQKTPAPVFTDQIYKFDRKNVNRTLVSSELPSIPDDITGEFPSKLEYTVHFELNSDGVIRVLSITPATVYPEIEASIYQALRSWMFNESPGSEPVRGTITLIIKAK